METETYLEVIPENIPQQLKELKQWTVWKPVSKKGKKADKVPYYGVFNEATGKYKIQKASVKNPDTMMTFEVTLDLLQSHPEFKGIQIILPSKEVAGNYPRIVGIDIDNAKLENGEYDPVKLKEIKSLDTYVEKSPSGSGLRGFGFASFPEDEGVHTGDIEVYQYGKALTVTGHIFDDVPTTVEPIQERLDAFRAKYFKPFSEIDSSELLLTSVKFTDNELISKIESSKSSDEFKDLFIMELLKMTIKVYLILPYAVCLCFGLRIQSKSTEFSVDPSYIVKNGMKYTAMTKLELSHMDK